MMFRALALRRSCAFRDAPNNVRPPSDRERLRLHTPRRTPVGRDRRGPALPTAIIKEFLKTGWRRRIAVESRPPGASVAIRATAAFRSRKFPDQLAADSPLFVYRLTRLRNMRNNIRNMRNSSVLTALFPQVRQGVLAATLGQPDKWWYLSELAGRLGTSPSSLQRELSPLVASGILMHRREGTRAYFKAETKSPVFRDLQQLFEKTFGLVPVLEQILNPLENKIQCAFVYGSVARSREHAMSDVDVMVIGEAGLADLSTGLRKAEARLG